MMVRPILAAAAAVALTFPFASIAQSWPAKPVRIIVPFGPGGTSDIQARLLAKRFQEATSQSVIVENRTGASGIIGTEIVVRAPADGHTLLVTSSSISVNTTLFAPRIKFDTLKDLAPVALLSSVPLLLTVHPSVPARSVKELVVIANRQKSSLNGSHGGTGTTSHIALEMLAQQAGVKLVAIPYKGGAPSTLANVAGEVDLSFPTLTTVRPHIDASRLRALAVTTRKPSRLYPQLPTMASQYPDFETDNWFGLFAPAGTPREIITKLNAMTALALQSGELKGFIERDGGDTVGGTPEELGAHLRAEIARYGKVIRAGNIKPD
jgi:tripartite-type tricarboxylate transporter receptor subunit TctC